MVGHVGLLGEGQVCVGLHVGDRLVDGAGGGFAWDMTHRIHRFGGRCLGVEDVFMDRPSGFVALGRLDDTWEFRVGIRIEPCARQSAQWQQILLALDGRPNSLDLVGKGYCLGVLEWASPPTIVGIIIETHRHHGIYSTGVNRDSFLNPITRFILRQQH